MCWQSSVQVTPFLQLLNAHYRPVHNYLYNNGNFISRKPRNNLFAMPLHWDRLFSFFIVMYTQKNLVFSGSNSTCSLSFPMMGDFEFRLAYWRRKRETICQKAFMKISRNGMDLWIRSVKSWYFFWILIYEEINSVYLKGCTVLLLFFLLLLPTTCLV